MKTASEEESRRWALTMAIQRGQVHYGNKSADTTAQEIERAAAYLDHIRPDLTRGTPQVEAQVSAAISKAANAATSSSHKAMVFDQHGHAVAATGPHIGIAGGN